MTPLLVYVGCLVMISVPIKKKHKLEPKIVDCIFWGYAHHSTTYKFLVIKSDTLDILWCVWFEVKVG
jgi:hypothetical protein